MMNDWTNEELFIIDDYRKKKYTYFQIQQILEKKGFKRNYESVKKAASKFGISKRRDSQAPMSVSFSNPALVDRTETLQGESVAPSNQPYNEQVIESFNPRIKHRVLAIGDIHAPFEHHDYLNFLIETYNKWNCDTVVCMGDEIDSHALSRYPSDADGWSAGHELEQAIKHLRPYYRQFPNVQVCTSNHTVRGFKRGFENGIPKAFFRSYAEILQAPPGWSWHESIKIDDVLYIHGEGYSGQAGAYKAALNAMRSTVIGHIHSHGGVSYIQTEFNRIFGLNVGCGVNSSDYAFAYGKNCAFKPTLGCGVIVDGKEAYFIPML